MELNSKLIFKLLDKLKATKCHKFYQLRAKIKSILLKSICSQCSVQKASSSTWSAMNALPTTITEPIFESIFNRSIPLESKSIVTKESQLQRDQAVELLIKDNPRLKLEQIQIGKMFKDLDRLFDLKNKHFSTVSVEEAAASLPKSTSSAFPKFMKKSDVYNENIMEVNHIFTSLDTSWQEFPSVIRWRTQQRRSGRKYRQFYMFGYNILTLEMMFAKNIFEHFRSNKSTSYCFGNVFNDLKNKFIKIRDKSYILSLDYTAFDQNVSSLLLEIAFKYIKSKLKLNNFTKRFHFDRIREYNMYCSIATKYKDIPIIFNKSRGIMSGSVFTNLIGTIVNGIMIVTFLQHHNEEINSANVLIMGDDCLIGVNNKYSLEYVNNFINDKFGASISIEKSESYSNDTKTFYFLGYEINEFGRFINPDLVERQLIFSEQFIPESVIPTKTRLFSKLASIVFKCTDGYLFWDKYAPLLAQKLDCPIPTTFVEIYSITGEPIDFSKLKSIAEYKMEGWKIQ